MSHPPRLRSFTARVLPLLLPLVLSAGCSSGGGGGNPTGAGGSSPMGNGGSTGTNPKALHVEGNKLVNGAGQTVRLLGVNRAGTEYMCVGQVKDVFDGPYDDAAIDAMLTWHINTVRIPLNESCWLQLPGTSPNAAGDFYQTLIKDYVDRLNAKGIYAVLDLHWSANTGLATKQTTMAAAAHALDFWTSVANTFKDSPMVLFDLYNEPILDDSNNNPANGDAWTCWLAGCTTREGWQAAGMQQMLDAVRATGAKQVVIANALNWGARLDGWLSHKPQDPTGNLMAGLHVYNINICRDAGCWNGAPSTVAAQVPLLAGEIGDKASNGSTTCGHSTIDGFMNWADAKGVSYLAWAWNTQPCTFPGLITNYDGSANAFGAAFKAHLLQVNP